MLAVGRHHRDVVVVARPCVNIIRPVHAALTSAELCALLELHVLISISNVLTLHSDSALLLCMQKGIRIEQQGVFDVTEANMFVIRVIIIVPFFIVKQHSRA